MEVGELLQFGRNLGTAVSDPLQIVGGGDGGTAAAIDEGDSRALDLTDDPVLGDADVGSVDEEAIPTVRNVGGHGAETGDPGEGEARETAEVEVVSINPVEIVFEGTCQFVAAEGGAEEGVGGSQSFRLEDAGNLGLELFVRDGSGEILLDELVERGLFLGFDGHDLGNTFSGTMRKRKGFALET